jgi:hypothetical protein
MSTFAQNRIDENIDVANQKINFKYSSILPSVAYYGEISGSTGRPKTNYVNGYYKSNGTYVDSYYRS